MKLRDLHVAETDHSLEQGLHVYGAVYGIDTLREPFLLSPYATQLRKMKPRFGNYHWDDVDKFADYMGDDVDPLLHGPYQARTVGMPMLDAQDKDPSDESIVLGDDFNKLLIVHHVQHDDHEGEFAYRLRKNTDEPFNTRTIETELEEFKLWKEIQVELFGEKVTQEHVKRIEQFAHPEARSSFKKDFWDISEAIGYLFTALRAREVAQGSNELNDAEQAAALKLAVEVSGRQVPRIEAVRREIVYADDVLLGFVQEIMELRNLREVV